MGGQAEGYAVPRSRLGYTATRSDRTMRLPASGTRFSSTGHPEQLRAEARALKHLGEVRGEIGRTAAAREALTRAVEIFEQVADQPEAMETASLLASLAEN